MTREITKKLVAEWLRPYECKRLYKYKGISSTGLSDIFSQNKIYLTNPTTFNDPFDCRPQITIHRDPYKQKKYFKKLLKKRNPELSKTDINQLLKNNNKLELIKSPEGLKSLYKDFISGIGIYCLSEKPDDILMWAHYAKSHTGICLEFDVTKVSTLFWESFKVRYQQNFPIVNMMLIGDSKELLKALLVKSSHWNYEEERRILMPPLEGNPEQGGPGEYSFQPELLTGVILGAQITPDDEKLIRKLADSHVTPITVYKAQLNEKQYKLDIPSLDITENKIANTELIT